MPQATATHTPTSTILAIADASQYATVEGNIYFPPSSLLLQPSQLQLSGTHTKCPWKGEASYYNLKLDDGSVVKDVGWFYPHPKEKAKNIEGFVAWDKRNVEVKLEG